MNNSTTDLIRHISCCLYLFAGLSIPVPLRAQERGFDFDPPPRQNPEKPEPAPFPEPKIRKTPSILPPILWASVVVAIVFVSIKLLIDYFDRRDRQRGWSCPHCRGSGRQSVAEAGNERIVQRKCRACAGKGKIKA